MANQKTVEEQLQEALAANTTLQEENTALKAENETLKEAAAKCTCSGKEAKPEKLVLALGEKQFEWVGPHGFVFEGKRYSSEEAVTDAALLGKLLKLPGQSFLKELE